MKKHSINCDDMTNSLKSDPFNQQQILAVLDLGLVFASVYGDEEAAQKFAESNEESRYKRCLVVMLYIFTSITSHNYVSIN